MKSQVGSDVDLCGANPCRLGEWETCERDILPYIV